MKLPTRGPASTIARPFSSPNADTRISESDPNSSMLCNGGVDSEGYIEWKILRGVE
jgi:hypothetical protein